MQNNVKNASITPNETKGRSVQDTKEILSYMLVASLAIQKQQFSPLANTRTIKTTTTSPTTSKVNNYDYYYSEQSIIKQALDKWQRKTCVSFIEIQTPTSGVHYLRFIKDLSTYQLIN